MASKRKSTTPCMIPVKTVVLQDASTEAPPAEAVPEGPPQEPAPEAPATGSEAAQGASSPDGATLANGHRSALDGYSFACKYCDFRSQDITQFVGHLNSEHTDFNKDPTFVCTECSFLAKTPEGLSLHNAKCHSGEASFVWNVAKPDNHAIVEQSLPENSSPPDPLGEPSVEGTDGQAEIIITKTPIMKIMKGKAEAKKIHTLKENVPSQPTGEASSNPSAGDTEVKRGTKPLSTGRPLSARPLPTLQNPPTWPTGPCWGQCQCCPRASPSFSPSSSQPRTPSTMPTSPCPRPSPCPR